MKKVLITARSFGQYSQEPVKLLENNGFELIYNPHGRPLKEQELIPLIRNVDGIIAGLDEITETVMESAGKLKVVARNGVGLDSVDIKAAERLGIKVTTTPGCNQDAVAELAITLMMDLMRQVTKASNSTKKGEWKRFMGSGLYGKKIGVVGLGNIGREVVKRLKGFEPEILVYDPYILTDNIDGIAIRRMELDQLLGISDIVTLHIPLVEGTRKLINGDRLSLMKKGSYIINTSRGGIVDEDALYDYVKNGHIAGAALDAFEHEPPTGSRLLELDNVIATPHIGSYTFEALNKMSMMCAQSILENIGSDKQ